MQNNRHFPQTENSLNNWNAPVRHAPGRYRDYREKYALTAGEVTARYCENITNPTVQPDGKTEIHILTAVAVAFKKAAAGLKYLPPQHQGRAGNGLQRALFP